MQHARIAELLQPFMGSTLGPAKNICHSEPPRSGGEEPACQDLSQNWILDISTYIDMLLRWNARINLTAIRNPEEIVTRHFGESLFAAQHLFPRANGGTDASSAPIEHNSRVEGSQIVRGEKPDSEAVGETARQRPITMKGKKGASAHEANDQWLATSDSLTLADLGSGAGFPGIPIKLWAPHIALTLIESNHKKAAFLREITRTLTLTDVNILTARAESITNLSFNVVTLRAVERFESILPTAVRLLAPGGRLALLIGATQLSAAHHALPNLSWSSSPLPIPLSQSRVLLIGRTTDPRTKLVY
jgi:16S rRNA G527 N7-methylase RsmG